MTLPEFKAWLDGYLDGKDGLTAGQVATVQQKLATVGVDCGTAPARIVPDAPGPVSPFWTRKIPVTCGGRTSAGLPDWLKGAVMTNMRPLGAEFDAAIFSDLASLYEN